MSKKYLDYAGLKRVLAKLLPGARKIWHGTLAEWNALSDAEKNKYDQAEIVDTGVDYSDEITLNDNHAITSNGVAKWLSKIGIVTNLTKQESVPLRAWVDKTFTFNNVEPGKYIIMLTQGNSTVPSNPCTMFQYVKSATGGTLASTYRTVSFCTQADRYTTTNLTPTVLTVTTKGTVTITTSIYSSTCNGPDLGVSLIKFA